MSKQTTPTGLFSPNRFSFGKILTPKTKQTIDFESQPAQNGNQTVKKTGLEAYAKKNKLTLPPDFSDKVLECEMELEKEQVSFEAVTRLTELYTQAMAYYEAEGNHKHKYFAKKLQDLMLKPNVKESMVREIAPIESVEDDKELKRMRLESQVSQVNTEKEAFALVKTHENKEKEIKRVLQKDLTSQRDRIQKKLAERKARSQSRAQSVNYISDEASSTTEEAQPDPEKDLDASPKAQKLIKIEEADEADENKYGTPPRRRSKDGQMIFYFPKGKKNLKKLLMEGLMKETEEVRQVRVHTRRYSENKPPVLTSVNNIPAAKRTGRAQSFCTRNLTPNLARKVSSNSMENTEETKTENQDKETRSLSGIGKDDLGDNHSPIEKKEEEKPKSNNTVEETDDEGSKNEGTSSKNSVGNDEEAIKEVIQLEKAEEVVNQQAEDASPLYIREEKEDEAVEEKAVVVVSAILNNDMSPEQTPKVADDNKEEVEQIEKEEEVVVAAVEQEEEKKVEVVEEVQKEEEVTVAVADVVEQVEEKQVEQVEEVEEVQKEETVVVEIEVVEQKEVEQVEEEAVKEVLEVAAQEEIVKEEVLVEKVEITEDVKEEEPIQENKENEVVVEEQEKKEETVQENNEEVAQEEKEEEIEQTEVVNEIQASENIQEEEVNKEEAAPEEIQEQVQELETVDVEATVQAETQEVNNEESSANVPEVEEEKQATVEVQEEVKAEVENIAQIEEPVAEAKVESAEQPQVQKEEAVVAAKRGRTDSEIADQEKLAMLRKLDEENKLLLEEFVKNQEKVREEAGKQVEEKFTKKLQAMEEDMEPDEKLSMMWQKAVAKINKDKETELQKVLEGLVQEHSQEAEKYKKKLQQQKMFKLAQMSS